MQIRIEYEFVYDCAQPMPMVLLPNVQHSRVADVVIPGHLMTDPTLPVHGFGNRRR